MATGDGVAAPALARGPGGELYAAWVVPDPLGAGVVIAARLRPDGVMTTSQRLSTAGDAASEPAIAVGPDGRVAVAWTTSDADSKGQVQAVHSAFGGAPPPPRLVSVGDDNAVQPDVAFDLGGVLNVGWAALDDDDDGRIKAAAEMPNGIFAAPRAISPGSADATEPAVAAVPGTGLAFSWTQTDSSDNTTVRVGIDPAANAPVGIKTVGGGGDASGARVAADAAGVLHVAWSRKLSETQTDILVSARNGAGGLDAPQTVSAGDQASDPAIAFSPAGDAAVTWRRNLGDDDDPAGDIRAAVYDASPPPTRVPRRRPHLFRHRSLLRPRWVSVRSA